MCTGKYHEYTCECIWRSAPKLCRPELDCLERYAPVITRIRYRRQCPSCQTQWLEARVGIRRSILQDDLETGNTLSDIKTLEELANHRKHKDRIMDQVKEKDEARLNVVRRGAGPVEGEDWVRIVERGVALRDRVSPFEEITVGQPPRRCSFR